MAKSRSSRPPAGDCRDDESGFGIAPGPASASLQLHLLSETSRLFAAPLSLARILEKFVAFVAGSLETGAVLLLLKSP